MKAASSLLVLGSVAYAAAQNNPIPSDISIPVYNPVPSGVPIPVFGGAVSSTIKTITFTSAFGDAIPSGYVTVMTLPVYASGPVYSTGTGPAGIPTTRPSASSETRTRGSSTETTPTPTPTPTPTTDGAAQQTGTNAAAGPMATAVGVPAAIAMAAGLALL